MSNPWKIGNHNVSAFERNRVLLNTGHGRFVEISHGTAADLDSDTRGVAVGDLNGDGMPDLIVRNSGGGPLRILENHWPKTNWLTVSLRGVKSNSLGLGAKLKVEVGGRTLWRELYPVSSFLSQLPSRVRFGLGAHRQVDRLSIYWPSGIVQQFKGLTADSHLRITEGDDTPVEISPGSVPVRKDSPHGPGL